MAHYKLVILSNPVDGREDEYNDWYSNQHLGDVVRVPGFTSAQRFKASGDASHRHLAIYDMECDDPAALYASLEPISGTDAMPISPALDVDTIQVAIFEPITGKVIA